MKSINKYIKESKHSFRIFSEAKHSFRIKSHLKKQEYKYLPKTKKELVDIIVTELKSGNTDFNCIDTSEITDMQELFVEVSDLYLNWVDEVKTIDISNWNVSNVTTMQGMFDTLDTLQSIGDVSNWNTGKVESIEAIFNMCEKLEVDVSGWDVSNVVFAAFTFNGCEQFDCDLSKWKVSKFVDVSNMFSFCNNFSGKGLDKWDIQIEEPQFMEDTFEECGFEPPKWYVDVCGI